MTNVRTVTTEELHHRLDEPQAPHVWNVQSDSRFEGQLIPGSRRMPLNSIEIASSHVPKDAEIITYCGGGSSQQSVEAARRLRDIGYQSVAVYRDGLTAWRAAGHQTVTPRVSPTG